MSDVSFGSEFLSMVRSLRVRDNNARRSKNMLAGFVNGLAQMASAGTVGPLADFPKTRSDEAFRSDWSRVGGDMRRGIERVGGREKAKA